MKKILFVTLIIIVSVLFVSCKNEPKEVAGTPKLADIDFGKYDAFAVMRETNGSKGITDSISGGINRLFGLAQDELEKITIKDDKGLEWACDEIRTLGSNGLLTRLSYEGERKNYFIDRTRNKILNLEFLMEGWANIDNYRLQVTSSGLYATKDAKVVNVDIEAGTMTSLTNSETDGVTAFWRDDVGNMLVLSKNSLKLFPYNGRAPIKVNSADSWGFFKYDGIRDRNPMCFIANSETSTILCLRTKDLYHLTSSGIIHSKLTDEQGNNCHYYDGVCLSKKKGTTTEQKVMWYSMLGYVTIHDLSSGELVFKKYNAPANLATLGNVAYWDGHLIYSDESGLYSLDLENQNTDVLYEGSIAKWQMATGGVIYTEYKSATENETYFLNLSTHEKEQLSSSGVEVVSIASFVE